MRRGRSCASVGRLTMSKARKPKSPRAATLADVGREAGVSAMAASAVLNSVKTSSRISADTRTRILEAAARLQYRPNAAARALVHRRMNTIGLVAEVDENDLNYYFLALFNGVLTAATHYEQNTTVFTLKNWGKDIARLRSICDGRIDGLILIGPTFDAEQLSDLPNHTPFVALHANAGLEQRMFNIESDEELGAFRMTEHLIALGHRRIMHISGPTHMVGSQRRIAGYKRALKAHGIKQESRLLLHSHYDMLHGREIVSQWLADHAGEALPHAVFCGNDAMALGCMEALAEVGLRVPDDISVAGFDDTLGARTTVPQLCSVRQPLQEMGWKAAEILLAKIGTLKDEVPASPFVMPVEVVPRGSAGPRPAVDRIVPMPRRS